MSARTAGVVAALAGAALVAAIPARPAAAQAATASGAQAPEARRSERAAHVLVVSGLGGAPEYRERFHTLGRALATTAAQRWGVSEDRFVWLAEEPRRDAAIDGESTRERVEAEIEALAGRAGGSDPVLVVLLGHGGVRDGEATLNLPGPDLTASQLAGWLDRVSAGTVAVVNTASASGGFLAPLSAENRIVVTATRSEREREQTEFPIHFVEALTAEGADADRNGRVSLLEAFEYARREVSRSYERRGQLQTEHALLDGDGDGQGAAEASAAGPEGRLAAGFTLDPSPHAARADGDPLRAGLLARQEALEAELRTLRARRDSLDPARYERELEALLLELARVGRALREESERPEEGKPPEGGERPDRDPWPERDARPEEAGAS